MKYDIDEICRGVHDGKDVWICEYRRPDKNKKPIRAVSPRRVMVVSKDYANKTIHYSASCFQEYTKAGQLRKSFMGVFDNTGFRSYTGEPLNVFDNEQECIDYWNQQLDDEIAYFEQRKLTVVDEINNTIDDLQQKKG